MVQVGSVVFPVFAPIPISPPSVPTKGKAMTTAQWKITLQVAISPVHTVNEVPKSQSTNRSPKANSSVNSTTSTPRYQPKHSKPSLYLGCSRAEGLTSLDLFREDKATTSSCSWLSTNSLSGLRQSQQEKSEPSTPSSS